jgi:hypothetical protein
MKTQLKERFILSKTKKETGGHTLSTNRATELPKHWAQVAQFLKCLIDDEVWFRIAVKVDPLKVQIFCRL